MVGTLNCSSYIVYIFIRKLRKKHMRCVTLDHLAADTCMTEMNWLDLEVKRSKVKVTTTPIMVKKPEPNAPTSFVKLCLVKLSWATKTMRRQQQQQWCSVTNNIHYNVERRYLIADISLICILRVYRLKGWTNNRQGPDIGKPDPTATGSAGTNFPRQQASVATVDRCHRRSR